MKFLQLEYQKASPDKHIINSLMDRAYPFRRKEILQQPKPIQQILKDYPPLKIRAGSCMYVHAYSYHTVCIRYTYVATYNTYSLPVCIHTLCMQYPCAQNYIHGMVVLHMILIAL